MWSIVRYHNTKDQVKRVTSLKNHMVSECLFNWWFDPSEFSGPEKELGFLEALGSALGPFGLEAKGSPRQGWPVPQWHLAFWGFEASFSFDSSPPHVWTWEGLLIHSSFCDLVREQFLPYMIHLEKFKYSKDFYRIIPASSWLTDLRACVWLGGKVHQGRVIRR